MIKNKKILVTGGAGTVGSNIVKKLVERQAQVTVIDNLDAYPFDYLHEYGVGDLETVEFVKESITNQEVIEKLIKKQALNLSSYQTKISSEISDFLTYIFIL